MHFRKRKPDQLEDHKEIATPLHRDLSSYPFAPSIGETDFRAGKFEDGIYLSCLVDVYEGPYPDYNSAHEAISAHTELNRESRVYHTYSVSHYSHSKQEKR